MRIFLITLLLASQVFALSVGWVVESQKHFFATTKEDIKRVVELYPRIVNFEGMSISKISKIDLTDIIYKYVGEHTCQENDPRLKENFVTWEVCLKDGSCFYPFNARPFPYDPCGIDI